MKLPSLIVRLFRPHWTEQLFPGPAAGIAAGEASEGLAVSNRQTPLPLPRATEPAREPVELLAGPFCGKPLMVAREHNTLTITLRDGRRYHYSRTDLRSPKGCKVFRFAGHE